MAEIRSPTMPNPTLLAPVDPAIEKYLLGLASRSDHPIVAEMEALAKEKGFPIVGRLVGIFLEALTMMIGACRIFEFGSGYGYSAYWFAKGMGASGSSAATTMPITGKKPRTFSSGHNCGTGSIFR